MGNLISVDTLRSELDSDRPPVVLDVRWSLAKPDGRADYEAGHLPGAVFVDMETELSAPGLPATAGRHPIPSLEVLEEAAQRWGVSPGDRVVIYDDALMLPAARAWWLLKHAGWEDVRVLNGGLRAWTAAGAAIESGSVTPERGTITLPGYGHRRVLDVHDVAAVAENGVLVDSRAGERFRGENEPMDPRAGHIPGARNVPAATYLRGGQLLPVDELRAVFAAAGVTSGTDVATTCGSGITAAHTALALDEVGIDAAVYAGSWSQWSQMSELPVETGPGRHAAR